MLENLRTSTVINVLHRLLHHEFRVARRIPCPLVPSHRIQHLLLAQVWTTHLVVLPENKVSHISCDGSVTVR